jgi:hypothetical protein
MPGAYANGPDREAIDADFAAMATDQAYQDEVATICAEFADADWEALQLADEMGSE